MFFQNSLFFQATVFSAVALGVMLASIWFFYFSPLNNSEEDSARPTLDTTLSIVVTLFASLLLLPFAHLAGRKLQGKPLSA